MGNDINTDMSEYTWGDFLDHAASVGAFGFIADIAAAENKLRAVEFFVKPAIYQDASKAVDALQRIYKDMNFCFFYSIRNWQHGYFCFFIITNFI